VKYHREFFYESPGERILKSGPDLPKLLSNIECLIFGTQCKTTDCHLREQELVVPEIDAGL